MSSLEEELKKHLEGLISGGEYINHEQFLIYLTEHFDDSFGGTPMGDRVDKAARRIKQAFIDDGWVKETPVIIYREATVDTFKEVHDLMTGQEWYKKFITELHECRCLLSVNWDSGNVMRAAKKASGIK